MASTSKVYDIEGVKLEVKYPSNIAVEASSQSEGTSPLIVDEVLFTFREYDVMSITLVESNGRVVKIDTYEHEAVELDLGKECSLNTYEVDFALLPGLYPIYIDDKIYYFRVVPQYQTVDEFNDMFSQLKEELQSFIYSTNSSRTTPKWNNTVIPEKLSSCDEVATKVLGILNHIDIFTNRGLKKALVGNSSSHTKEFKLTTTLDTAENRQLYADLSLLLQAASVLLKDNADKISHLQNNILCCNQQKLECSNEYQKKHYLKDKAWDIRLAGGIADLEEQISSQQGQVEQLVLVSNHVCNCLRKIKQILTGLETEINSVSRSKCTIKNPHYRKIHTLIGEFIEGNIEVKNNGRLKRTDKLFEYFSVIRVYKVLNKLGYLGDSNNTPKVLLEDHECWLRSVESPLDTIRVVYDKSCPIDPGREEYKGIISVNSQHTRPDLVLYKYHDGTLEDIQIIEVKYRKSAYIYNPSFNTKTFSTMLDYKQLAYYTGDDVDFGKVSKVILLYPKQQTKVKFDNIIYRKSLSFIQLSVSSEINLVLEEELSSFVNATCKVGTA